MMTNLLFSQLTAIGKRLAMVLTMLLIVGIGQAWGAAITIQPSSKCWTTTLGAQNGTINGITISTTTGSLYYNSNNNPAQFRIHSGATFSVASSVGNITKIDFTFTGASYQGGLKISYTNLNSTSWSATLTGNAHIQKIVVTIADSYTVTWTINPAAGGTLSATSGNSTTVSPNAAYTYGAPAYTVTPAGKANVSQDENNFTATPSADCTIQINMVEKTPATISFENMGNPTPTTTGYYVGDTYTLPATNDYTCGDKTFVGWSTDIIENSATKPTAATYFEPGASVTLAANQTFYAVFATSSGNGSGYTKLNWGATISAGKYLISTGNYTISGRSGNKTSELAVVEYSPTSNEAKTEYEVKIEKIGDYFSIKLPDDTWWVGWNTSTSTNLTSTSPNNDTKYLWQYTENGIQNISAETRYLQVNYANSAAKVYTTTNNNTWHATYLYAQATSYTDYTTQCTTQPSRCLTPKMRG